MKIRNIIVGRAIRPIASRSKKQAALALCVSLWMAGGSVAGATEYLYLNADDNNTITPTSGWVTTPTWDSTAQALSVTGGDWSAWFIYGGKATGTVNLEGYHLTLSKVQNMGNIYGASTTGSATNNYVTATDCTGTRCIYGGQGTGNGGNATGNHVTLTNVTLS